MSAVNADDTLLRRGSAPQPAGGAATDHGWIRSLAEIATSRAAQTAYSPSVLCSFVRFFDLVIVAGCGLIVDKLYLPRETGLSSDYQTIIISVAAVAVIVFQSLGLYRISVLRSPLRQGLRLASGLSFVFLAALAIVFFAKLDGAFSRVWLSGWFAMALIALMIARMFASLITESLTRQGRLDRRVAIVGGGASGEDLLTELSAQRESDLRIYGVFDDRVGERSSDVVAGYPKLGTVDDLVVFARHARLDLVIFALPITAEQRLLEMLRKLWVLPIDIRLAAHNSKLRLRPRAYSYIGAVPVLDLFDKPIAEWDVVLKSAFDRIVGAALLLLLSPVLLAVALAIKLDSRGPALFRQKRYGFNNELIEIYKFRSMYVSETDANADKLVTRNDPRVTRVGRFIRRTSLDELPQLFNVVFKGNLSLVGPRPHAVHAKAADREYDQVVEGYFARHRVRPGITGWAQINGWRGETDTQEKLQARVEHDLHYIENWSLGFDLYILAMTPYALLKGENAY